MREVSEVIVSGATRSIEEIQLFLDLHPCPTCGERSIASLVFSIADTDDGTFAFYEGPCPRCGTERRFRFEPPPSLMPAPAHELGGPAPSQILGPDELRRAADHYLAQVAADPASVDGATYADGWRAVRRAVIATRELAKFPGRDEPALRERAQALHDAYRDHGQRRPTLRP
jgi:hypothetical protein